MVHQSFRLAHMFSSGNVTSRWFILEDDEKNSKAEGRSISRRHSLTLNQAFGHRNIMKTIALAGATTGFKQTVLDHFLRSQHLDKLVLLTRSLQPHLSAQGIDVRPIDYSNHDIKISALQGVHTILSFIGGSMTALQDAQISHLSAAKEAGATRFAPSE